MAVVFDIRERHRWFKNAAKKFRFTCREEEGGAVDDISGFSLSWLVKKRVSDLDASALITKTTASGGITITDGPNGICLVSVLDSDTINLAHGTYVHELKRLDAGLETVYCHGSAILLPSAHRS